jgi:electron transfer flavoprotein alpha subunit
MRVLVIAHSHQHKIKANLAQVLSAAHKIHAGCDVLLIGDAKSDELAQFNCINKILHLHKVADEHNLALAVAPVVATIVKNYTHVLCAADSYGKDLLPRVAGINDLSQISEVSAVISPNIFKKLMYAGNVIAEIESFEEIKLLSIRPTSFSPYPTTAARSLEVQQLNHEIGLISNTVMLREELQYKDTIDLAHAQIVVSGGRSLGSKEDFTDLINGLARKLHGAVGASRAAVEAGYASNDSQVGQTGKVVAPQLYVAIGISGAVQHIAGMKDSQVVIAINLDPNAQIFEYANYGLIGDLFEIVPKLMEQL